MKAEDVDKMLYEWRRKTMGMTATHLLLHPDMMQRLYHNLLPWAHIKDERHKGKPPAYAGLEIVEVDPWTHPEDYAVIVGGNP